MTVSSDLPRHILQIDADRQASLNELSYTAPHLCNQRSKQQNQVEYRLFRCRLQKNEYYSRFPLRFFWRKSTDIGSDLLDAAFVTVPVDPKHSCLLPAFSLSHVSV